MCASAIRQARIKEIYYNESNRNSQNIEIIEKILSVGIIAHKSLVKVVLPLLFNPIILI